MSETRGGLKVVADSVGRLPYFSHASVVGDLIFVSGTLGTQADGFDLAPGGVGPETKQALVNIREILRAAGADLADVVKMSAYVVDMDDFLNMNTAYAEFFPPEDGPPARITLAVSGLALNARVEFECVAVKPAQ